MSGLSAARILVAVGLIVSFLRAESFLTTSHSVHSAWQASTHFHHRRSVRGSAARLQAIPPPLSEWSGATKSRATDPRARSSTASTSTSTVDWWCGEEGRLYDPCHYLTEGVSVLVLKRSGAVQPLPPADQLAALCREAAPFRREVLAVALGDLAEWVEYLLQPFTEVHSETSTHVLQWLRRDIEAAVSEYTRVLQHGGSEGALLDVKLELGAKVRCPKFHVDKVFMRALCTYVGPGTEWLDNADADRAAMASGGDSAAVCRGRPERIQRAEQGDLLMLMGGLKNGVVHRSPPLAIGERRLLLTIDESLGGD
ncbi:hypothetical protein JKP88DRAFT_206719 [Tribonema minus]|uniref:DUF1826 domain-containing protein n=1 Tax=Tribonema minus TaxID=303371 RepID=A0A836CJZ8_9STRA|nr:hypothetical protein JKP88DRAFT_206719 [Tribonema minus]